MGIRLKSNRETNSITENEITTDSKGTNNTATDNTASEHTTQENPKKSQPGLKTGKKKKKQESLSASSWSFSHRCHFCLCIPFFKGERIPLELHTMKM